MATNCGQGRKATCGRYSRFIAWVRRWSALWAFLGLTAIVLSAFLMLPLLSIASALNKTPRESYTLTVMRLDKVKKNIPTSVRIGQVRRRKNQETETQHLVPTEINFFAARTGFGVLEGREERVTLPLFYGDVAQGDTLWVYYCPEEQRDPHIAWYVRVIPKALFEHRRLLQVLIWGVWLTLVASLVLSWFYRDRIPGWREEIMRKRAQKEYEAALRSPPPPYTGNSKKVRRREARRRAKLAQRPPAPNRVETIAHLWQTLKARFRRSK